MNLAIYNIKTKKVVRLLRGPVTVLGHEYRGTNGALAGLDPRHFGLRWTLADSLPGFRLEGQPIDTVPAAPEYDGHPVGSRAEVNAVVRRQIAAFYSIEDELKIMRQRLAGDLPEADWQKYRQTVEQIVAAGRSMKEQHFPAGPDRPQRP